jgi:hypothetical protein
MSNSKSNKEQNQLITLTPEQQDCGRALPTDFVVTQNTEVPATPAHGQCGSTAAEHRRLLREGCAPEALPARHVIPQRPTRA